MGTHPIFESDFDCLTDCESDYEFPGPSLNIDSRSASLSNVHTDSASSIKSESFESLISIDSNKQSDYTVYDNLIASLRSLKTPVFNVSAEEPFQTNPKSRCPKCIS